MVRDRLRILLIATLAVVALAASACSGSFEFSVGGQSLTEAAVELIEGDAMRQRLNVEPITDATCVEPATEEVGVVFECQALSAGTEIQFEVELESETQIFASPVNVVEASLVNAYATSAVDALNAENDFTLAAGSLDCGSRSVVLDADNKMYCLLDDPATNTQYDVELTVRDLDRAQFGVQIVGVAE